MKKNVLVSYSILIAGVIVVVLGVGGFVYGIQQRNMRNQDEKKYLLREIKGLKNQLQEDGNENSDIKGLKNQLQEDGNENSDESGDSLSVKERCEREGIIAKNDETNSSIMTLNNSIDDAYDNLVAEQAEYEKVVARQENTGDNLYSSEEQAEINKLNKEIVEAKKNKDRGMLVEKQSELSSFYYIHGGLLTRMDAQNTDRQIEIQNAQYSVDIASDYLNTLTSSKEQVQQNLYEAAYEACMSEVPEF